EHTLDIRGQCVDLSRGRCLSIDDLQKSFARDQLCHRKGNQNGLLLNLRLTKSRNSLTKCANHGATKLIDAQHFSQLQSGIPLHKTIFAFPAPAIVNTTRSEALPIRHLTW